MTTKRRYTTREKVQTVVAAELTNAQAASESTGVPVSTVRYWMDDPAFDDIRAKTREDLVEGASLLTHRILGRISATLDDFEPRDLTILFGVMVDKGQLLSGGATARTESRDITGSITDAEVRDAIREAHRLTSADRVAEAPTGETAG